MLPAFESQFTVGTERTSFDEPSGRWGATICKDMDFPKLSRQYGNDGVGLLLVPAWDFNVDGWLHGRMAILRGVESGFSIARAPKQGILTLTDNRGRVLAEAATNSAPFVSLLARVPVQHESTLYARWGDWFAWVNVAFLALTLLVSFTPGTRARESR
jgi:apolipoprotein N-acyltransferase